MKFKELRLDEKIYAGIKDAGFTKCTQVQAETLPIALSGRDVAVQSQTGTGKTAAFLISIFQLLSGPDLQGKKALIVAPTRELAVQIEKEAKLLARHLDIAIGCFYGGAGYRLQETLLQEGTRVMVGTPGRLMDFARSGKLNLREVGIFIIDEADRLFDMGFIDDIQWMFRKMVPPDKRITMLFSATLDTRVRHLAWRHMNRPVNIEIDPESVTVDEVEQVLYHVGKSRKVSLLLGILKKEAPQNALIFTNTKRAAVELAERLKLNGYPCRFIIGDLPQRKRLQVIDGLKSGKYPFLVATDVAARGLHVEDLDMVVNYDLPEDREGYVHRIGRTARAGRKGKAVSLVCEEYVYGLEGIESFTGEKIPVGRIEESMFEPDKSDGVPLNLHRYKPAGSHFADRRKRSGHRQSHPGKRTHRERSGPPGSGGRSHRSWSSHRNRPGSKPRSVKA